MFNKISGVRIRIETGQSMPYGQLKRKQLTEDNLRSYRLVDADYLSLRAGKLSVAIAGGSIENPKNDAAWLKTGTLIFGKNPASHFSEILFNEQIKNINDSVKPLMEFALMVLSPEKERRLLAIEREGNVFKLLNVCKFWQAEKTDGEVGSLIISDLFINSSGMPEIRNKFANFLSSQFPVKMDFSPSQPRRSFLEFTFGLPGNKEAKDWILNFPIREY